MENLLSLVRSVSLISASKGQTLLGHIEKRLVNQLTNGVETKYYLNESQREIYASAFDVEAKELVVGQAKSTHPISASLRDDASVQAFKYLHKLHEKFDGPCKVLRLFNPTQGNVNKLLNENLFDRIEIYSGPCHYSDVKRTEVNLEKLKFPDGATQRIDVVKFKITDINDIFRNTNVSGRDTHGDPCVLLLDDMYHVDANVLKKFFKQFPKGYLLSAYSLVPILAYAANAKQVTFPTGNRVLFHSRRCDVSQDWENFSYYKHILEDGTYYTGYATNLEKVFSINTVPNIGVVSEPLNKYHHMLIASSSPSFATRDPREKLISIHCPGKVVGCYEYKQVLNDASFNYFRNFVMATKPSNLTVENGFAAMRSHTELQTLTSKTQFSLLLANYADRYDFENVFKNSNTTTIATWGALVTATGWKYVDRMFYKFAASTNLANFEISEVKYLQNTRGDDVYDRLSKKEIPESEVRTVNLPEHFSDPEPSEEKSELQALFQEDLSAPTVPTSQLDRNTRLENRKSKFAGSCKSIDDPYRKRHPRKDQDSFKFSRGTENANLAPKVTYLQFASIVEDQLKCLQKGSMAKNYDIINKYIEDFEGKSLPVIDHYVLGLAGAGKTKFFVDLIGEHELSEIVVVCPTGEAVIGIQKKLSERGIDWKTKNKYIAQTYERALKHIEGKHVIFEEAFMIPSYFFFMIAMLRSLEVVKSFTYTGDIRQNLFNEQIIPEQEWNLVLKVLQTHSIYITELRESWRIPKIVATACNALFPDLNIVSNSEVQGSIKILKHLPMESLAVPVITQSNDLALKTLQKGYTDVENTVKAQGKTHAAGNIFVPTNHFYESGFYVGMTRTKSELIIIEPSNPSAEMLEKIQILREIVDCHTPGRVNKEILKVPANKIEPEAVAEMPRVVVPLNLPQLNQNAFDNCEEDIVDPMETGVPAMHHPKNKQLVKRSMKASFKVNPELITEKVDLQTVFPDLADFHFNFNEEVLMMYTDRYLTKLKSPASLRNQILADKHEMLMNFKTQMKGAVSARNKQNNEKVGQIVRATSKYYQLLIGVKVNALAEQIHDHLRKKNHFTGCSENDHAAANFINKKAKPGMSLITFDTVKNESRIGPQTKAFEREFMAYYSHGVINLTELEQMDRGLYVRFGNEIIDCSLTRNSGEVGTLFRNFLANTGMVRLRLLDILDSCVTVVKGDNTAIFASISKPDLLERFRPLEAEGQIEIDKEPEWTNYKLVKNAKSYSMIPNYSVFGERILGKFAQLARKGKVPDSGTIDNYKINMARLNAHYLTYGTKYPELFNDSAVEAHYILRDYN